MIGSIKRLIDEAEAQLCAGPRASYWCPIIQAARDELKVWDLAFNDQTRELENAVAMLEELGPEHALEYRRRTYPGLYPRNEEIPHA